ncbi:MAG TPA: PLDc N-terminal domain-containing protein [Candidatus Limnocylindrales bacterium]|nr:PLDc N-terminal domain-containing protein [Candidatus Limnocylindrales bacterium]
MADLSTFQILALLAPLVVIELALKLIAFFDIEKDERRVRGGNKIVWALIILLVSLFGPLLYLLLGRIED